MGIINCRLFEKSNVITVKVVRTARDELIKDPKEVSEEIPKGTVLEPKGLFYVS